MEYFDDVVRKCHISVDFVVASCSVRRGHLALAALQDLELGEFLHDDFSSVRAYPASAPKRGWPGKGSTWTEENDDVGTRTT